MEGNHVQDGNYCELPESDRRNNALVDPDFVGYNQKKIQFGRYEGLEPDNKRIRLMCSNQQIVVPLNLWEESIPLGLTLKKTPSFLNLIEMNLSRGSACERMQNIDSELRSSPMKMVQDSSSSQRLNPSYYNFTSQPISEKLKASNFPADLLKIGSWKRVSRYEGDIVAKCYYAKHKLVWEVLDSGLKSKIEIQWSDISAIRATFHKNGPGILEVELSHPPLFFRETNPQPRKHTLWQTTTDFTRGQAPLCRRHYLQFPEGTLDKHYLKLLQCDQRLYMLSQRPFPSLGTPYFSSHGEYEGYMYDLSSCRLGDQPGYDRVFKESPLLQFPHYDTMKYTAVPSWQIPKFKSPSISSNNLTSPRSVADFRHQEGVRQQLELRKSLFWEEALENQQDIVIGNGDQIEGLPMSAFANQITPSLTQRVSGEGMFTSTNWALHTIAEDLLNDQIDEQSIMAEVNSMHSILDAPMQIYSTIENTDNIYDQYYDSKVQLPVQDSIEHISRHLPQVASYPYIFSDQGQAQEDFECNDLNIQWHS
ncbi:hypothetical protein MRB53_006121 [Persea americana]|uniref:Uncharacterized protein n=1 Tax=Persea americana TaxID=3435 RepID=A0ACC2MFS9_PERAE|nr:hypothetical protein MRB53_006121 [Persea americana]